MFESAVDELESASELCAASVMNCVGSILSLRWEKSVDLVEQAVDYTIALIKENFTQSKTSPPMMRAIVDMVFQPEMLSRKELLPIVKKAMDYIMEIGELKPFVVAQMAKLLHAFWLTRPELMVDYASEIVKLLAYGPLRDREDQKLEAATVIKLQNAETIREAQE